MIGWCNFQLDRIRRMCSLWAARLSRHAVESGCNCHTCHVDVDPDCKGVGLFRRPNRSQHSSVLKKIAAKKPPKVAIPIRPPPFMYASGPHGFSDHCQHRSGRKALNDCHIGERNPGEEEMTGRPDPLKSQFWRMRILMLSDVYFPRINGVSTSIQTFAQELINLGHTVTLIAPAYPYEFDQGSRC